MRDPLNELSAASPDVISNDGLENPLAGVIQAVEKQEELEKEKGLMGRLQAMIAHLPRHLSRRTGMDEMRAEADIAEAETEILEGGSVSMPLANAIALDDDDLEIEDDDLDDDDDDDTPSLTGDLDEVPDLLTARMRLPDMSGLGISTNADDVPFDQLFTFSSTTAVSAPAAEAAPAAAATATAPGPNAVRPQQAAQGGAAIGSRSAPRR